jgi:hypothetical protein
MNGGREGKRVASVVSMVAKHRAWCVSPRSYRKDGTAEEEGMFGGGHDHDTFSAFMHFTENTTGVGACVHAQYWGMIRHSRTIDTRTHHWQRDSRTGTLYVFSLLADFFLALYGR